MIVNGDVRVPRVDRLAAPASIGLAGAGAFALLHFRDPHESGSYGFCPFLLLTGHPCPGCGGLRAMNDLSHGDVVGALSSNILAVLLVALLVMAWMVLVVRILQRREFRTLVLSPRSQMATIAVFVLFGVVRNTPWGAWLAP